MKSTIYKQCVGLLDTLLSAIFLSIVTGSEVRYRLNTPTKTSFLDIERLPFLSFNSQEKDFHSSRSPINFRNIFWILMEKPQHYQMIWE